MDAAFLFSIFAPAGTYLAIAALAVPFILYVIARWRVATDPHLGIKVALNYFAVMGLQVALAGAFLLVYAILSVEPDKGSIVRAAFGLIVPGGIVLGAHTSLLRRTNQEQQPGVARLFAGYNLLLTGTLGFVGLVLASEALFGRGAAGKTGRIASAMVMVYGTAWIVIGWQFGQRVLGAPAETPPAPAAPPGPAAPQGPTLPSLGGGSFPPVR